MASHSCRTSGSNAGQKFTGLCMELTAEYTRVCNENDRVCNENELLKSRLREMEAGDCDFRLSPPASPKQRGQGSVHDSIAPSIAEEEAVGGFMPDAQPTGASRGKFDYGDVERAASLGSVPSGCGVSAQSVVQQTMSMHGRAAALNLTAMRLTESDDTEKRERKIQRKRVASTMSQNGSAVDLSVAALNQQLQWVDRSKPGMMSVKRPNPGQSSVSLSSGKMSIKGIRKQIKAQGENTAIMAMEELASGLRGHVQRVVDTQTFDFWMGIVIVINSIIIGAEVDARMKKAETVVAFAVLENLFLGIYVLELAARFWAYRLKCLRNYWVRFDLVLVVLGVLGTWVLEPLAQLLPRGPRNGLLQTSQVVLVLRVFRLFRLARTVRLIVQFRALWMLVQGLINSITTVFYTCSLVILILYIFACISMELITIPYSEDESDLGEFVKLYWSGIPYNMLTLIRVVFMDSASEVYEPLIKERWHLLGLFLPIFMLVPIALMNLVTAVVVEGALQQAKHDQDTREMYKKQEAQALLPFLRDIFHELDADSSGFIVKSEVANASDEVSARLKACLGTESLSDVFDLTDVDNAGAVSIDEFCDCIANLASSDKPIETFVMMKHLQVVRAMIEGGAAGFAIATAGTPTSESKRVSLQKKLSAQLSGTSSFHKIML